MGVGGAGGGHDGLRDSFIGISLRTTTENNKNLPVELMCGRDSRNAFSICLIQSTCKRGGLAAFC